MLHARVISANVRLTSHNGIEMADVFRKYRHLLPPLPPRLSKVVTDIVNCRTAALGGHLLKCNQCNYSEQSYNSCRNRHCPKCQFLAKERWVQARVSELLPVQYFHVVFTVPHQLKNLAHANKKIFYDVLFKAASETLLEVARNPKNLGAEIGFTAVLHTWGQNLMDHPHLHIIVPGGGIATDGMRWVSCSKDFLLPLKILSLVFRGKFLNYLEKSYPQLKFASSTLDYAHQTKFKDLLVEASKNTWVIYAKPPFAGPAQVVKYLGNYTHRIAISNYRLIRLENDHVIFKYKDYADGNKRKLMRIHVKEFMRRFLMHVLPEKFVRIRYYGFLARRSKKKNLTLCRTLLQAPVTVQPAPETWKQLLKRLTDVDIDRCPHCKQGALVELHLEPRFKGFDSS